MKTTIWLITLVSDADLSSIGNLWLRFGLVPILLGVLVSLVVVLWALRNAPEGYEDETGFQFRETRAAISDSAGVAMLRPHNAG